MSYKSKFLEEHGWKCVSSKRRGSFLIQKWSKSGCGASKTQEEAYNFERHSNAMAKLKDALEDLAKAESKVTK